MPYEIHLVKVAMEVMAALPHHPDLDADLCIQSALLHDVVEDTPVSAEQLRAEFGDDVARCVLALTKNDQLPKSEKMQDSLDRIHAAGAAAALVKLADRITNMAPPPANWSSEKRAAYLEEAQQILLALGKYSPFLASRLLARMEAYKAWI
jgi:guanosine-3',5'-bis(diphosphate) 3'-pyrophosphohydrolase